MWWGVDFNCIMAGTLRGGLIRDERGWRKALGRQHSTTRENSIHRLLLITITCLLLHPSRIAALFSFSFFANDSENCKYLNSGLSRGCRVRIRLRCSSLAPKGHYGRIRSTASKITVIRYQKGRSISPIRITVILTLSYSIPSLPIHNTVQKDIVYPWSTFSQSALVSSLIHPAGKPAALRQPTSGAATHLSHVFLNFSHCMMC